MKAHNVRARKSASIKVTTSSNCWNYDICLDPNSNNFLTQSSTTAQKIYYRLTQILTTVQKHQKL